MEKGKKRIEYLDAMRGFTMILVVLGHVVWYGFNYPKDNSFQYTFYNIFAYFRMPLFFFVSGFILYKQDFEWNLQTTKSFLTKKLKVQILSTLIFYLLYCYIQEKNIEIGIFSIYKYGYWFTITLFEFFIFYVIFQLFFNNTIKENKYWNISYILYILLIITLSTGKAQELLYLNKGVIIATGFTYPIIQYLVFFSFGIFVKKYFSNFLACIENSYFMACILILFLGGAIFLQKTEINNHIINLLSIYIMGIAGITMVFGIFYKHQHGFSSSTHIGRILQYIGKRTLDIFLLHYFFITYNIAPIGNWLQKNPNPSIDLLISLVTSLWIIALCLIMSNVLRSSHFLGKLLFGIK